VSDPDEVAKELFGAGAAQFRLEHYGEARALFERAYALSKRKALLYNVGLAADRQGDTEAALAAYEEYLASEPDGERVDEVRRRVRTLRAAGARPQPPAPVDVARAQAPPAPEPSRAAPLTRPAPRDEASTALYERWWLWALVGAAVAGGVVAAVALNAQGEREGAGEPETSTGLRIATLSVQP
jgi:tetratricopeptide (TPR) repeat protein